MERALIWIASAAALVVMLAAWRGPGVRRPPINFPTRDEKPARPADSATFFADRNTVVISVPYPMTVDELIARYRLEESRNDILQQAGVKDGAARLQTGRSITVTLTPLLEPLRPRGHR